MEALTNFLSSRSLSLPKPPLSTPLLSPLPQPSPIIRRLVVASPPPLLHPRIPPSPWVCSIFPRKSEHLQVLCASRLEAPWPAAVGAGQGARVRGSPGSSLWKCRAFLGTRSYLDGGELGWVCICCFNTNPAALPISKMC